MTKITMENLDRFGELWIESWMYIRKDEILSQGKGIEINLVCRKVRADRTKSVSKKRRLLMYGLLENTCIRFLNYLYL